MPSTIKNGGSRHSGLLSKNAPAAFLRARFVCPERILPHPERNQASSPASRSLATALPEGALARGLLRLRLIPRIDRPTIGCNKLPASEAPDPGRHHLGTPGDIISECPGDIIGIRSKAINLLARGVSDFDEIIRKVNAPRRKKRSAPKPRGPGSLGDPGPAWD